MKTLLEKLNPKKVAIIIGAIIIFLAANRLISNSETTEEVIPEEKIKSVEIIDFGHWTPDSRREITGTLESGSDVNVQAEVSGTIAQTFVSIGDEVKAGQALASFQKQNDATQISYENLLQQLAVTKIQTTASIQSAETGLSTAQRQLEQTENSESQNYSRTFDLLGTSARNAESTFRNTLDWADHLLAVSNSAKSSISYQTRHVGKNNYKARQVAKNQVEELLRERDRIDSENLPASMTDEQVLWLGENRLEMLRKMQIVARSLTSLVQGTPVVASFPRSVKSGLETEATGTLSGLENALYGLESQIEAAKSEQGRNKLSVLGVSNAVSNAEAAVEVTRAQAASQISQLETQIRLARTSQADLTIRAPFAGTITGKEVVAYDQVRAGSVAFSMVGTNVKPKLSATITSDELARVMANANDVKAELEDGTVIELPEFQISGKLDSMTQKLTVDFPIEEMPENILVGSFVKILLPIDNAVSNLLPISAISFEPGGAETLVVKNGEGKRVEIEVGKLVSNAVEINGGLEFGAQVVRYRTRAHAGEKLEIK